MTIYVKVKCFFTRTVKPYTPNPSVFSTILSFDNEPHLNYYFSDGIVKTDGSIDNESVYDALCEGLRNTIKYEWSPCGSIIIAERINADLDSSAIPVMPLLTTIISRKRNR